MSTFFVILSTLALIIGLWITYWVHSHVKLKFQLIPAPPPPTTEAPKPAGMVVDAVSMTATVEAIDVDFVGTAIAFFGCPEPKTLDHLAYVAVTVGFPFLTLGILTGAIWANSAWGTYWSWDPKETWSLITWFVYATLLHARMMRGWYGKKIAYLSILGFGAVMFTYFGVNLLPGLHSYGSGG